MKKQDVQSWVYSVEDYFAMELFVFAGATEHSQLFPYVESDKDLAGYARRLPE